MSRTRLFLFDLDGTIYLSGVLIPGVTGFLDKLEGAGIDYAFMTNNSSLGPAEYLEKLLRIGLRVEERRVLTSSEAAVLMLGDLNCGPNLFVIGSAAFKHYLRSKGYDHTEKGASAVLVGFDTAMSYDDLTAAARLVHAGVPLFATHPDVYCPGGQGLLPDAGATLAFLETATGKKVQAIAGKPHRWIVRLAQSRFDVGPDAICVVGDRLQTDIKMGREFGMRTILPLTGATGAGDLVQSAIKPDLVVDSVAALANEHWSIIESWLS